MERTLTLKDLSQQLASERSGTVPSWKTKVSRYAKTAGFPVDRTLAGPRFNLAEVRAWLDAQIAERGPTVQTSAVRRSAEAPEKPAPRELDPLEKQLTETLSKPGVADVDRAQAAFELSSLRVSKAYTTDELGPRQLEEMSKQSQELRRARADYLDLAERSGALIPRDVAIAVAGEIALAFIGALTQAENTLPTQVEIWMSDPGFNRLSADERRRTVRTWFEQHGRTLREQTAQAIEQRIAAELQK